MTRSHQNSFDQVRLFAAVIVIWSHSFLLLGHEEPEFVGQTLGTLAVQIFLGVSGYLICGSWMRDPRWLQFFVRRFLRIFPGLVTAVFLSTVLVIIVDVQQQSLSNIAVQEVWKYLWNNALALCSVLKIPGVLESNPVQTINGSLWTIRYELLFYLVLSIIAGFGWLRYSVATILTCLIAAWLAKSVLGDFKQVLNPLSSIPGLWRIELSFAVSRLIDLGACFAGGVLLYLVQEKIHWSRPLALFGIAFSAAIPNAWGASTLAITVPYFAIAFGRCPPPAGFDLRGHDLSYGLYIYGYPIQQLVSKYLITVHGGPALSFALSLAITLPLAAASWIAIERPALALKRNI